MMPMDSPGMHKNAGDREPREEGTPRNARLEDVRITIHRRTPGSGHLTAELGLDETVKFADAELAQGRVVILEIGSESQVIRIGEDIVAWVKRLFGKGQPTLTTLAPMAGGAVEIPPPIPPLFARRDYDGPVATGQPSVDGRRYAPPEAEVRAWNTLVERIGERGARGMLAGGGYAVRSTLWPYIVYVVTPEIIKVVNQGVHVSSICIVTTDGSSVWDTVLNRIQLLEAGADGEVQVYAAGRVQHP